MQESKNLARALLFFFIRIIKRLLHAAPFFERAVRLLFRRFPIAGAIYFRLMSSLSQHRVGAGLGSAEFTSQTFLPPPRKRALSPRAAEILIDLKTVMLQNNTQQCNRRADSIKFGVLPPPSGSH